MRWALSVRGGCGSRYPGPAEPDAEAGAVDGAAGGVDVVVPFGGDVVGAVGGGAEVESDADELPVGGGAAVVDDGGPVTLLVLSGVVVTGDSVVGAEVGVGAGDTSLVVGRGRGACGLSAPGSWGSTKRPSPSPATARTEPAAFCAMRTRLRVCTPARRRARCSSPKGVYSWVSRIIRVNSRSKWSIGSPSPHRLDDVEQDATQPGHAPRGMGPGGAHRAPQYFGDLPFGKVLVVAQYHRGPLPRRELGKGPLQP